MTVCEHDEITQGCDFCDSLRPDFLGMDVHLAKMKSKVFQREAAKQGVSPAEILATYLDCLPMSAEATSAGIFGS